MENIKILCDTDVIIEYFKGNQKTKATFEELQTKEFAISAITLMELFYGARNKRELVKIKKALKSFDILLIDENITQIAIELIEKYSKSHGLKIPDALIATTAISYKMLLWTYNIKDFRFIAQLRVFS